MDQLIIDQKLESLRRCAMRLQARCPDSAKALAADIDAQDIVSLNLTRAIQLCVDIAAHWLSQQTASSSPQTMGQTFALLAEAGKIDAALAQRLRQAVGFRNIVVHNYEAVEWEIVFHLCRTGLSDFQDFARAFVQ